MSTRLALAMRPIRDISFACVCEPSPTLLPFFEYTGNCLHNFGIVFKGSLHASACWWSCQEGDFKLLLRHLTWASAACVSLEGHRSIPVV